MGKESRLMGEGYLTRLGEILELANSKKITDRRTFVRDLQEVYTNDDFVKTINSQSRKDLKGPKSWNEIMLIAHRVAVSEAERQPSKNAKVNTGIITQYGCADLMCETVRTATVTSARSLICNDLMACLLEVLGRNLYQIYHNTYVKILANHVLMKKMYWIEITAEQWRALLNIIIKLYRKKSKVSKIDLLNTVTSIVERGCLQSHLTLDVKKILPFLEETFGEIDDDDSEGILRPLYRLTYAVCQQIGTESRIQLCDFSQKYFPRIICLKEFPEKIDLLLLMMLIHHPGGTEFDDAGDKNVWRNMVSEIHWNIVRDVDSKRIPQKFWDLCCEVYREIILDPTCVSEFSSSSMDEDDDQPIKRRRLMMAIEKPSDLLLDNDSVVTPKLIRILTLLLKKYPSSLKSSDYPAFLKTVTNLIATSTKHQVIMENLCQLCTVVLKAEKEHYGGVEQPESVELSWQRICDFVSQVVNANEDNTSGHVLLQSIISHKNVLNTNGFLYSYLKNHIRWSYSSVETLLTFCLHMPIPNVSEPGGSRKKSSTMTRASLLRWALNIPRTIFSSEILPFSLANLLVALSTKFSYKPEVQLFQNRNDRLYNLKIASARELESELFDNRDSKTFSDIERCHLALEFRENLFEPIEETPQIDARVSVVLVREVFDSLIAHLSESLSISLDANNVSVFITKTTVAAKILSIFLDLNAEFEPMMLRLFDAFTEAYKNILSQLLTMREFRCHHLVHSFEALELFYRTRYNYRVAKTIVDSTPIDFAHFFYKFKPNKKDLENDSNDHMIEVFDTRTNTKTSRFTDTCRVTNAAHHILTHFCCVAIGEEMTAIQTRVVRNLLNIEIYKFDDITELRCALAVIKAFSHTEHISTNEESLIETSNFLPNLLKAWGRDEIVVRGILNVLPRFVKSALLLDSCEDSFLQVLSDICSWLVNEKYGPLVHLDLVKCLIELIRLNPLLKCKIAGSRGPSTIVEIVTNYINSPFYLVQLEVARAVHEIFSSENLDVPWKLKFFETIIPAIANLFDAESTETKQQRDKLSTRSATALYILAGIICACKCLESRALHAMIELSVQKDVKIELIKKALFAVTKSEKEGRRLLEINLHYLLSRWIRAGHPLQAFPCALVDCDSPEDFSRKYIGILLSTKLQRFELREFKILCNNIDASFSQTIEQRFPCLMSLLMSMMVREGSSDEPKRYAQQTLEKLRSNSGEFAEVESFDVLLKEQLPEVVLEVISRLNDREHFYRIMNVNIFLPKLNSPSFNAETVNRCLRRLQLELRLTDQSLIEYFVRRRPSAMQKILLTLFSNVYDARTPENKILAFYRYVFFCTAILEEISLPYFDPMSLYVIRDVSQSLLTLMKEEKSLSELASSYFRIFLSNVLPARAREVSELLSFVVAKLIPIIQEEKVKSAIDVLHYLIDDQKDILGEAIEKLVSFPNENVFQTVQKVHDDLKYSTLDFYALEDEFEHFLNVTREKTANLQGLFHIHRQLTTRKKELNEMYEKLERIQDSQEDSASSTLHKLICKLVQLARSNSEISHIAAKCLGQFGPADLATTILHAETQYGKEYTDEGDTLTFKAISLLVEYLVENNLNLRRASSEALYGIFSTTWGSKFLDKSTLNVFVNLHETGSANLHDYIYPFGTKIVEKTTSLRIHEDNWRALAESKDLWTPTEYDSYSTWIVALTCRCLDCFVGLYAEALKPICRLSVEFCEMIVPRLVHLAMRTKKSLAEDVCVFVNRFFRFFFDLNRSIGVSGVPAKRNVALSYECVKCMLNIVNFIRVQTIEEPVIDFQYLHVAKAAQYCSAYFTSIFYAELWCETLLRDSRLLQNERPGSWTSPIDSICDFDPENGELLQHIVRAAYLHINDPDGIFGCGLSYLMNSSFKTQYYVHQKQWSKVTLAHDVAMYCGKNVTREMHTALQQAGHQYLAKCVINQANKRGENVADHVYENAWRLADWSILETHRTNDSDITQSPRDFHASHYRALQSVRDGDSVGVEAAVENARKSVAQALRYTSLECSETFYPLLSRLQMLEEIEEFAMEKPENINRLVEVWNQQDFTDTHDFQYVEPILTQRLVMYQMQSPVGDNASTNLLLTSHLKIAEVAETQGYLPIAYRVLGEMVKKFDLSDVARNQLTYQKALLDWKEKDQYMSRLVLRSLLAESSMDPCLRGKALRTYGNWMAETTGETSQDIIHKYYKESINASSAVSDLKTLTSSRLDLAKFADNQYQQIVEYTKTPHYESLVECRRLNEQKSRTKFAASANKDETRAIVMYRRQLAIDAEELKFINADMDMYLQLAVEYYLKTLATSNDHDVLVYRFMSLWLDNMFHGELNKIVKKHLPTVASHKFVDILPQLATHMSNALNNFTVNINGFIERCVNEHPHHTLPILIALKNTHKDQEYKPSSGSQRRSTAQSEPRLVAIDVMISRLIKSNISPIYYGMYHLSLALISLAYYKVPEAEAKKLGVSHRIPENQAITKIRNLQHTPVPTVKLDVRPSGNYANIVGVQMYEETFEILEGVEGHKKIVCVDCNGNRRLQLLKGQYEIKRDAVLQQFFIAMNSMLKETKETSRRKLRIRTHQVLPLSRRSGLLEWCQNAIPISRILCGSEKVPGLHTKYYPNDWSVSKCRTKLREVHKLSNDVKLKTYLECCKNVHPALHHYFMEKYPSPETWFEKRLAYTRSVATSSMIGYMLGLGNRGCNSILIDQTTAEVIHVDFSVVLALGKVPVRPETVPFRLTRDIEAAMGICGVEGAMKRSCALTVSVLREKRKSLMTILQILLYDPLCLWTLIPDETHDPPSNKSSRFSLGSTQDAEIVAMKTNKVAERALTKIQEKLEGIENGLTISVSGQVDRLIQEARDPDKLSCMFYDWQPYL